MDHRVEQILVESSERILLVEGEMQSLVARPAELLCYAHTGGRCKENLRLEK